jgi:two-component system phosphate regulon response regulator PhoB
VAVKKRILVADDDRGAAMLLRHMLMMHGYEVEEVYQGSEALRRVSESPFDLLLLDFNMRDIKGDRVCLMLRMDEKTKDLPIMIVTAHTEREERIFKEYGATEVVYKPPDPEEFIRKVRNCLKEN